MVEGTRISPNVSPSTPMSLASGSSGRLSLTTVASFPQRSPRRTCVAEQIHLSAGTWRPHSHSAERHGPSVTLTRMPCQAHSRCRENEVCIIPVAFRVSICTWASSQHPPPSIRDKHNWLGPIREGGGGGGEEEEEDGGRRRGRKRGSRNGGEEEGCFLVFS